MLRGDRGWPPVYLARVRWEGKTGNDCPAGDELCRQRLCSIIQTYRLLRTVHTAFYAARNAHD